MSFSSPGQGHSPWLASTPAKDWPIDYLLRSGARSVPVALVPTDGGSIPMKNPKAIQVELRKATSHPQEITEVRQFGRGGILCCSADQECIRELLQCSEFAAHPVSPFIPAHLACSKGLVRGVDTSLTPADVLDLFSVAGVISVYRCTRTIDNIKSPTESVIVTFLGTVRPSEIKAWPLIYKVEPLSPKPLQCLKCWRYGHSVRGCRSVLRCRLCGENHDSRECSSEKERCCLCNGAHPADSADCAAKERELAILDIVERKRCSRREAVAEMQERSKGYASVAARNTTAMDASLATSIAEAVEKAMEKAMERLANNLFESLAQLVSNQLSQILGVASTNDWAPQTSLVSQRTEIESATTRQRAVSPEAGTSKTTEDGDLTDDSEACADMDMDSHKALKRTRSPQSKNSSHNSKSKKYLSKKEFFENMSKKDFLRKDILDQAVSATVLSSK